MAMQKAVKTYPWLKWLLAVSVALLAAGLVLSKVVTDPNNADPMTLIWFVVAAAVVPFLALALPRRQVVTMELPSDSLAGKSRTELQGLLDTLEEAKRKGEITPDRYNNARDRIVAAMKTK